MIWIWIGCAAIGILLLLGAYKLGYSDGKIVGKQEMPLPMVIQNYELIGQLQKKVEARERTISELLYPLRGGSRRARGRSRTA